MLEYKENTKEQGRLKDEVCKIPFQGWNQAESMGAIDNWGVTVEW